MKGLALFLFALSVNAQCRRQNACRLDGGVVPPGQNCRPNTDGHAEPDKLVEVLRTVMAGLRPIGIIIAMSNAVQSNSSVQGADAQRLERGCEG
ncbi:hypothetical protein DER46DRAFT_667830 [Fusarium sp. MPI-SDFR-AT-0072]|nr:hypothetical protein DER46DRAFT_667830 [Fusarium sp. MPI-SDFR-AT-0072]